MKKGFTLAELLMVVIVAAVLAAIALPSFSNIIEKRKAKQAIETLRLIRAAQQIYFANHGGVYACSETCWSDGIRTTLGVNVTEDLYSFTVTAGNPAKTFIASAIRLLDNNHVRINVTESCVWSGDDPYKPAAGTPC